MFIIFAKEKGMSSTREIISATAQETSYTVLITPTASVQKQNPSRYDMTYLSPEHNSDFFCKTALTFAEHKAKRRALRKGEYKIKMTAEWEAIGGVLDEYSLRQANHPISVIRSSTFEENTSYLALGYQSALVFDIDDTLFDTKTSQLIHPEEIKEILESANTADILLCICTSRRYYKDYTARVSVKKIADDLGADFFTQIIYTNGSRSAKLPVLRHIAGRFGISNANIAMIDDCSSIINKCKAEGYTQSIHAKQAAQDQTYLTTIKNFIDRQTDALLSSTSDTDSTEAEANAILEETFSDDYISSSWMSSCRPGGRV